MYHNFNGYPEIVADVNGDKKADLISFGLQSVSVYISTGTSFNQGTPWSFEFTPQGGQWDNFNSVPRLVADVNGDGKADIIGFSAQGNVRVSLSTGQSFAPSTIWLSSFFISENFNAYPTFVADVNGDGKGDVVSFKANGVYVALSTGSNFTLPTMWCAGYGTDQTWDNFNGVPRILADVDGDGMADIIGFATSRVIVSFSNGTAFGPGIQGINNFVPSYNGWTSFQSFPRFAADVNGDGKADIVGYGQNGIYVSLSIAQPSIHRVSK